MCSMRVRSESESMGLYIIGLGTSVDVVSEEQKATLLDSRLCCWLMVNSKCARLECMRVPLVKVKQQ